jgi:hypothetical protein
MFNIRPSRLARFERVGAVVSLLYPLDFKRGGKSRDLMELSPKLQTCDWTFEECHRTYVDTYIHECVVHSCVFRLWYESNISLFISPSLQVQVSWLVASRFPHFRRHLWRRRLGMSFWPGPLSTVKPILDGNLKAMGLRQGVQVWNGPSSPLPRMRPSWWKPGLSRRRLTIWFEAMMTSYTSSALLSGWIGFVKGHTLLFRTRLL